MAHSAQLSLQPEAASRPRSSDGSPDAITAKPQQTFSKKVLLFAGTFCLIVVGTVFVGTQPAHAYHPIRFCNQSPKAIKVIWGSTKGNPLSAGYWLLRPSECQKIETSREPGLLYAGAKVWDKDVWWRGSQNGYGEGFFCVDTYNNFTIEKDGASFRDRYKNSGWNTCSGLGKDYGSRPLAKSPHTYNRTKRRKGLVFRYTETKYFERVCTAKFQADFTVSWSCSSWERTL